MSEIILYLPSRAEGMAGNLRWRVKADGPLTSGPLGALPKPASLRLVFDARDVWMGRVQVPALNGKRLRAAILSTVEEQLAPDLDALHIVSAPVGARAQERWVAAIDRQWLKAWVERLEGLGFRLISAVSAAQLLPHSPGAWTLRLLDGLVLLRAPSRVTALSVHDDNSAQLFIEQCLRQEATPPSLRLQSADHARAQQFAQAISTRVTAVEFQPTKDHFANLELELLVDEYARGARWWLKFKQWLSWRHLRVPMSILALSGVISLVALNIDWWRLSQARRDLRADILTQFQQSFPKVPAVLDPVLQMRRELARLRGVLGESHDQDPLSLMARAEPLLAPKAQQVESYFWQNGELQVRFSAGTSLLNQRSTMERDAQGVGLRLRLSEDGRNLTITEQR